MLIRTSERKGHLAAIYALQPAPDGFYSVAADGFLVHWHLEDVDFGQVIAKVEGGKFLCLTTLSDKGMVAGALDGGVHWLYPGAEAQNRHLAHHSKGVFSILRVGEEIFTGGGDGVLTRWSASEGRTLESLPLSANSLRSIAYHPDQDLLAAGASDGHIYLLERSTLKVLAWAAAHEPSVFSVAFSVDGAFLYSGGRDTQLAQWAIGQGSLRLVNRVPAHLSTLNAIAPHPSGRYLATASRDKTVKLWDSQTLRLLKVCEVVRDKGHVNSVNTLIWLDEQRLLTAGDDRRILEWQLQS